MLSRCHGCFVTGNLRAVLTVPLGEGEYLARYAILAARPQYSDENRGLNHITCTKSNII